MKKKKPNVICDAVEAEGGAVRLTFTRWHRVREPGAVLQLSNGPHRVLRVQGRYMLTVQKIEAPATETAEAVGVV
jgi:hypothetical protein